MRLFDAITMGVSIRRELSNDRKVHFEEKA